MDQYGEPVILKEAVTFLFNNSNELNEVSFNTDRCLKKHSTHDDTVHFRHPLGISTVRISFDSNSWRSVQSLSLTFSIQNSLYENVVLVVHHAPLTRHKRP